MISRREFVKTTSAAAVAASLVPSFSCMGSSSPFDPKGLPTRILGKTGVKVPRMAVGLGVIAMKVIRPRETVEGLDPKDLIRYALSLDHFSVVNIGTDNMDVLKANLELIRNFRPMPESRMEEIRLAMEPFYHHKNLAWMKPGYVDGKTEKSYFT